MKKAHIKGLAALLASAILLTSPVYSNQTTDSTVKSYEDQLAYVGQMLEQTLAELESLRANQYDISQELIKFDELIALTEKKKKLAVGQLETIEDQIKEKEDEILKTTEAIEAQEDAFLKRMASNYMEGNAGYLDVLLNAESLIDFLARVDRLQAIRESDKAIIDDLNQTKNDLVAAKEALGKSHELQKKTVKDFEAAIMETSALYSQKQDALARLQEDESAAYQSWLYFSQLDKELNAELENYLAELQRKQQSVYVGGSLAWPLDPAAAYWYSSEFGWRTLWGQPDNHYGLDIACAQNTKIYAANAGTVIRSEEHWSYGNYVLIDHGGGMATLYAHMTSRAVSVGEYVQMGQTIGYVGMTGTASGHHLHFEVRVNGAVQQPRNYISGPND